MGGESTGDIPGYGTAVENKVDIVNGGRCLVVDKAVVVPHEHPNIVARSGDGESADLVLPRRVLVKAVPPVEGDAAEGDNRIVVKATIVASRKDGLGRDESGTEEVVVYLAIALPVEAVGIITSGVEVEGAGGTAVVVVVVVIGDEERPSGLPVALPTIHRLSCVPLMSTHPLASLLSKWSL